MVTMKVTTACASLHNETHAETGLYRGRDCSVHPQARTSSRYGSQTVTFSCLLSLHSRSAPESAVGCTSAAQLFNMEGKQFLQHRSCWRKPESFWNARNWARVQVAVAPTNSATGRRTTSSCTAVHHSCPDLSRDKCPFAEETHATQIFAIAYFSGMLTHDSFCSTTTPKSNEKMHQLFYGLLKSLASCLYTAQTTIS